MKKVAPRQNGFIGMNTTPAANLDKKMKNFPVKYCPECKKCYERGIVLIDFPTIGLERVKCYECRNKKV